MGIYGWHGVWVGSFSSCIATGNLEVTSRYGPIGRYTGLCVDDNIFLSLI